MPLFLSRVLRVAHRWFVHVLWFVFLVELGLSKTCLPDAIAPGKRKSIKLDNISIPVSIWRQDWGSGELVARLLTIIAQEVLGYEATDQAGGGSTYAGLLALAGCTDLHLAQSGGDVCQRGQLIRHHIVLEGWPGSVASAVTRLKRLPDVMPVKMSPVGYESGEGVYVSSRVASAALADDGVALDYYRSYNVSWHDVRTYFDNYLAISPRQLKRCNESRLSSPSHAEHYWRATNDKGGVVVNQNSDLSFKCWQDRWFLSPACRQTPESCIPLLTASTGWGIGFITQQIAVHNMPVAVAVASESDDWVHISKHMRCLFYWFTPDVTFVDINPSLVRFPQHDAWEWSQGVYSSQMQRVTLHKYVSVTLRTVAPLVYMLLDSFHVSARHLKSMLVDAKGNDYAGAACRWLQRNKDVWNQWIALSTACIPGQGLVNAIGASEFNRSAAVSCDFCPAGTYSSELIDELGLTYVCQPCVSGSSQKAPGSLTCTPCRPGTYAADSAVLSCSPCRMGAFASTYGSSSCELCPPGTYSGLLGSIACTPCRAGFASEAAGSQTCDRCDVDSFAQSTGQRFCTPCVDGRSMWLLFRSTDSRTDCQLDLSMFWTFLPGEVHGSAFHRNVGPTL
eukprot:TRINITY_DN11791_c0_g1_i1.p1 TRINITY_DN11791_c0_g1~~TRINITY_DN11791_c0_g1_i1.p1  ORF type:complete len:621 (-),score=20.39 TRINITY_DN11791_c0_g1_i1:107-1969(-)